MPVGMPIDVRALYDMGRRLKEDRERIVRIAVLVEVDAPDELVEAARQAFHPRTAGGVVDVSVIEPGYMMRVDSKTDAAVVLAGSATHLSETLDDLRKRMIPAAVVALRDDRSDLARMLSHPFGDVVTGTDPRELVRGPLADWAIDRLEKLRVSLANNFEFVRSAVAREIVKATSWQNAAIGVVMFIPGADMPLMTLNQGKMLLRVAAAYGQPLDSDRVKELGAVVAGGFLFRTFARQLVGLVPGFGWAVKGGIAYSGTMAMGTAAIAYFEEGADLPSVVRSLTERAEEAAMKAASRLRRRGRHLEFRDEAVPLSALPGTSVEGARAFDPDDIL